jgi:hypothetical protein
MQIAVRQRNGEPYIMEILRMANGSGPLIGVRTLGAIALSWISIVGIAPSLAQSANVSELFGARVEAVPGAKSPLVVGDFDGDGKADAVYFVNIAPGGADKAIASDVHVVTLYHGHALDAKSSGHALAIALDNGAQKFLVVDFEPGSQSFFESPSWANFKEWSKQHPAPPHAVKRGSADLKGYPCLGKATKGDVLMLLDEAGIDEALAWTGKSFKTCIDPTNDP